MKRKDIEDIVVELQRQQATCDELINTQSGVPIITNYPDAIIAGKKIAYNYAIGMLKAVIK